MGKEWEGGAVITRKSVTLTIDLTFVGEYISAEDVVQYAENWIDSGLYDRDDLIAWKITSGPVTEAES